MKAVYSGSKTYSLIDDRDHPIGTLTYTGVLSQRAQIQADGTNLGLTPKKLGSMIELAHEAEPIGTIKMKWSSMVLELSHDGGRHILSYRFVRKGFWKPTYALLNADKEILVKLTPAFRSLLRYDYEVSLHPSERFAVDKKTVLLSVFCANYLRAAESSMY